MKHLIDSRAGAASTQIWTLYKSVGEEGGAESEGVQMPLIYIQTLTFGHELFYWAKTFKWFDVGQN